MIAFQIIVLAGEIHKNRYVESLKMVNAICGKYQWKSSYAIEQSTKQWDLIMYNTIQMTHLSW